MLVVEPGNVGVKNTGNGSAGSEGKWMGASDSDKLLIYDCNRLHSWHTDRSGDSRNYCNRLHSHPLLINLWGLL